METLRIAIVTVSLAATAASESAPADFSPGQRRMAQAHMAVVQDLDDYRHYNDLALALAHRGEEIADPDYYLLALGALEESLRLNPENQRGKKMRAWMLRRLTTAPLHETGPKIGHTDGRSEGSLRNSRVRSVSDYDTDSAAR